MAHAKTNLPPILVVDDEPNMRDSLRAILRDENYDVETAESAEQALGYLDQGKREYFVVITDGRLGGTLTGYDLLRRISRDWANLPVIFITAYATPKLAVEAIQAGAVDYLSKPFQPEELLHAVERCHERYHLIRENTELRTRTSQVYDVGHIVGDNPKMAELRQLIRTVGPSDANVLILGESGTGKEIIAGALHLLSKRKSRNYIRINCAAIPEALLESELFGHEKGAFTGALRLKRGRVEEADGGSIFLDEIGDMSRPLQAKLLRFLEDGSFTRVGGNEELQVDVRIIAATNRDIVKAIRENEFREDLFHRLNVMQFRPTPLRDRGTDILILAKHFLKMHCYAQGRPLLGLTPEAERALLAHKWPGNVRELRNVIERAVILESGPVVRAASLPDFEVEGRLRQSDKAPEILADQSFEDAVSEFEKRIITQALEQNHQNVNRAAEQLKMTRHALRYRMQRLNLLHAGDGEAASENA
ncbi:MAG: sigma-54-dependent Fis family transcriptional regulator [Pedosphaera sp.]|nr:sigma-54-dependent Fis family transcriptional regulator [Pedosphaera sp.]